MSETRSEKCPLFSRFGGGWVTPANYLAELVTERLALHRGRKLPLKPWTDETWKREYFSQLRLANSLLKIYPFEAILRALRSEAGKTCFSLSARWLDPLVADAARLLRVRPDIPVPTQPSPEDVTEVPRPAFGGKSVLSLLKDDDGQEEA